ncbi:MAG: phytoene/squalene synthase family protein, partial [Burkholderiaceae bacterium]
RALPANVRRAASTLYAFCRLADDAIDVDHGQGEAVTRLRARLDAIYAGRPAGHAIDRALADVVSDYDLPRLLLDALLEGLEWDASGRHYDTAEELMAYAARVAGSVGAMMTVVMDRRSNGVVARACDLGVAMQLTNIARDVAEDARLQRIYLPRQWLREVGIDPARWLRQPQMSAGILSVVERLLEAAEVLYERAASGVAALPPGCRPAIHAARLMYSSIGHEVRRLGLDSMSVRAVVPKRRKAWLIACALAAARTHATTGVVELPPLDATRFLVDAVVQSRPVDNARSAPHAASSLVGMIELFDRLQRRQVQSLSTSPVAR